jgi:hypothetical protein
MSKLKQYWDKIKLWVGLFVAGVAISFLVFRKTVGDGLAEQKEQLKIIEDAKELARKQLEEEKVKLEEEKQKEVAKAEEEKKQKLKEAVEKAKVERDRLKALEKRDAQGFVIEMERELGVKQKKKKGKRKKDEQS